jgi:4-hydroxy-tetrahydrodipicolinate reductase
MDMNIALIGRGAMGREVAAAALSRGHTIIAQFSSRSPLPGNLVPVIQSGTIDCCIDVSVPSAVLHHVSVSSTAGIPLVIGTTGWQEMKEEVLETARKRNGTLIYGNNFSVGAQMFFAVVRAAARLMNDFPEYDTAIDETHHVRKKDAPSGTALTLAQILIRELDRKKSILAPVTGMILPEQIGISSTRIGNASGTHTVRFRSAADEIELVHRAFDRSGFAAGAVLAAELTQRYPGIHAFDELIASHPFTHHS